MFRSCEKCDKEFDIRVEVNSKKHYLYKRKLCFDCSPYKQGSSAYYEWLRSQQQSKICSGCKLDLPIDKFYLRKSEGGKNKPQSLCIECNNRRAAERSGSFKEWAVEYKGGKCVRCGYDRCLDALQFHHRGHSTKEVTPAKMKLWSREKAQLELDKCELVCANCHAEIHHESRATLKPAPPS